MEPIDEDRVKQHPEQNFEDDSDDPQIRPWLRCWARWADYVTFSFFCDIPLGNFEFEILYNNLVSDIILVSIWTLVEPFLLSTWGYTPGKWFFKIKVRDESGKVPSLRKAFKRSWLVWFMGVAFMIPLAWIVTMVKSRNYLSKNGITPWDQKCGLNVQHQTLGRLRVTIMAIFCTASIFLITIGYMTQ